MTKRITALLLALLMVIGTVPAPAFAADDGNATEETTQTVCSVCNLADCTATHTQCEKCGNYDCTADHSNWCDICKKNDCGVDHSIQILVIDEDIETAAVFGIFHALAGNADRILAILQRKNGNLHLLANYL